MFASLAIVIPAGEIFDKLLACTYSWSVSKSSQVKVNIKMKVAASSISTGLNAPTFASTSNMSITVYVRHDFTLLKSAKVARGNQLGKQAPRRHVLPSGGQAAVGKGQSVLRNRLWDAV